MSARRALELMATNNYRTDKAPVRLDAFANFVQLERLPTICGLGSSWRVSLAELLTGEKSIVTKKSPEAVQRHSRTETITN